MKVIGTHHTVLLDTKGYGQPGPAGNGARGAQWQMYNV